MVIALGMVATVALAAWSDRNRSTLPVNGQYVATLTSLAGSPVDGRGDTAVAWTGDEFVVVGGQEGTEKFGPDGEPETSDDSPLGTEVADAAPGETLPGPVMSAVALHPDAASWRELAPSPLSPRTRAVSVWTGDEVLVWGGTDRRNGVGGLLDGALYDPSSDTWRSVPDAPSGTDRSFGPAAVVGGHVVITAGSTPQSTGEEQLLVLDLTDLTWEVVTRSTDGAWFEPVRSIQPLGDATLAVLRERRPTEAGTFVTQFTVERFDPAAGTVEMLARVDDPLAPEDDTYTRTAGLLGDADRLLLALTDAEDLTRLYDVEQLNTGEPPTSIGSVRGLVAPGSDEGFGPRPHLTVDGAVGAWSYGLHSDLVVLDPDTLEAAEVALSPENGPRCGNSTGHASGDQMLLLVSGDCAGLLLRTDPVE